jgi:SAM-dependent methyltransferase
MTDRKSNADAATIASFGDEWSRHDQSGLTAEEHAQLFDDYFGIFPWTELPTDAEGFDMGCGSGRWAQMVAPRVGTLNCIDPAEAALDVTRRKLDGQANVRFHLAPSEAVPLAPASQDFGYSLGVLHHIPDTESAMRDCTALLKPGAPFLVYLYYRFDNRPAWFRAIWKASELLRGAIAGLPPGAKGAASDVIAVTVYWPLARLSWGLEKLGMNVSGVPLSHYRDKSFGTLRTDARDRFGTPLEQRFTRAEITAMMTRCGLTDIRFSDSPPFWVAVGRKV